MQTSILVLQLHVKVHEIPFPDPRHGAVADHSKIAHIICISVGSRTNTEIWLQIFVPNTPQISNIRNCMTSGIGLLI